MDNIRATIDLVFTHRRAESIIDSHLNLFARKADTMVCRDWFIRHFHHTNNSLTNDQSDAVYKILTNKWLKPLGADNLHGATAPSVFNLLTHFTESVLIVSNGEPRCRYEQLLRWNSISSKVGQDLLTTSYLAWTEIHQAEERSYFSWRPVITHDNPSLLHIMKKGVADLHFHLKGSSLNFELNWLSLMNSIKSRRSAFKEINRMAQSPEIQTSREESVQSLHVLCVKACAIRLLIFESLFAEKGYYERNKQFVRQILEQDSCSIVRHEAELNQKITLAKQFFGHRYGESVADYAIPKNLPHPENYDQQRHINTILSGERRVMYGAFRKIYSGDADFAEISDLFYAYLAIKEKVRHEIVQLNNTAGFENFAQYERRKDLFIPKGSIYETLLVNLAINSTIENQTVSYLEARITPKGSQREIGQMISDIEKKVCDRRFIALGNSDLNPMVKVDRSQLKPFKFHYILHFIKQAPVPTKKGSCVSERNNRVRMRVKQQAMAISQFRRKSFNQSGRVVGIDAANAEIGCRAEVFAQAFRYLRYQPCIDNIGHLIQSPPQSLGCTYHVGEDYLDIADGLRAIDEAIQFLGLKRGDRLGHALALGVCADRYYSDRHNTIVMPKQDFLDNVVWIMIKSEEFGFNAPPDLLSMLKRWYHQCFREIYNDDPPALFTYYQSWLLRGDSPRKYFNKEEPSEIHVTYWDKFELNQSSKEIQLARKNKEARELYYKYHFDNDVRRLGELSEEYHVCSNYIDMISYMQDKMCRIISGLHISIEANPSSNHSIGALERYYSHPIVKFYNHGLNNAPDSPQIAVSINTDDQGVFCTSIENEFALMALSIEKQMDSNMSLLYRPREVYQWIDNVRELAFEQTFLKD